MNDMSWDGSVDSVSTRKPSRFENDEFIKAKAEPWVCYIGMYPDPLTSAAVAAQTVAQGGYRGAQIASDAAIATAQETGAGLRSIFETAEQALQTAQMIAALYQTIKEWDTAEKTRRQWEARNSAEFGAKASEYNRQRSKAATQRDLALKNIGNKNESVEYFVKALN